MNRVAPPLILLLLSACAGGTGTGPSLLPRAAERQSFEEPAAVPAALVAADPALDQRIAALVVERAKAVASFAEDDRRATARIAAGTRAKPGSDAWLDAQTALGALDAGRAAVLDVLTALETLAGARAAGLLPPYPALETARADTEVEADRISAIVATRKAALPL